MERYYNVIEESNPDSNGFVIKVEGKNIESFFGDHDPNKLVILHETNEILPKKGYNVFQISKSKALQLKSDYNKVNNEYVNKGHCSIFEF